MMLLQLSDLPLCCEVAALRHGVLNLSLAVYSGMESGVREWFFLHFITSNASSDGYLRV